ncbi:hypothetical protein ACP70R_007018 [Stipagrostis hirtigluma subsp. patula]
MASGEQKLGCLSSEPPLSSPQDPDHLAPSLQDPDLAPLGSGADEDLGSFDVDSYDLLAGPEEYDNEDDDEDDDMETTCPGERFTRKQAREITDRWVNARGEQTMRHWNLCQEILKGGDENAILPPYPLKILPETTLLCAYRGYCYHREYRTCDPSMTRAVLGYDKPQQMLQVFSLTLSSSESYPISLYGSFAVRDYLEPLRNYVFNRTRDDPVTIEQDSFALPLCSPCRGMYVEDRIFFEVDLWVKKEGDGSADKQLLFAYVEVYSRSNSEMKVKTGRISRDHCLLDMGFLFLPHSVEAVIEVFVNADIHHHVRFTAFSSGLINEIILFNGKGHGKGKLFQHVVVVSSGGELKVCLELEKSLFWWTFQDGAVGAVCLPDDSISDQYHVRVFFAPKNLQ